MCSSLVIREESDIRMDVISRLAQTIPEQVPAVHDTPAKQCTKLRYSEHKSRHSSEIARDIKVRKEMKTRTIKQTSVDLSNAENRREFFHVQFTLLARQLHVWLFRTHHGDLYTGDEILMWPGN